MREGLERQPFVSKQPQCVCVWKKERRSAAERQDAICGRSSAAGRQDAVCGRSSAAERQDAICGKSAFSDDGRDANVCSESRGGDDDCVEDCVDERCWKHEG